MKTILKLSLAMIMVFSTTMIFSQALITDGEPGEPHPSALLELESATKGFMPPQIELGLDGENVVAVNMEVTPADGLVIYYDGSNTSAPTIPSGLWYYDASLGKWIIYSRAGSVFSNNVTNYGIIIESDPDGAGTTYSLNNTDWTGWSSANPIYTTTSDQFDENLDPTGTTPGSEGDKLINNGVVAHFTVQVSMVVKSSSSGIPFRAHLYVNRTNPLDSEFIPGAFVKHYFQTGGEYATLSASALIELGNGESVEVRMKTDNANETVIVEGTNLRLAKIGE
ncbi:MAG: hypothetical protein ABFS05_10060 [Bacteroidota bacterium]